MFVFVFMLWPVIEAKRSGVPSKAHEPVYTRPYACPSQHHNLSIRDVVTMPEMVTLDVIEWCGGVYTGYTVSPCYRVIGLKCDTFLICYGWLGGVHVLSA